MAKWKVDESGKFIIHKSLHLGTRGPNGSEYVVENLNTGKIRGAKNLKIAMCMIAADRDGVKLSPYYQENAHESCRATGDIKDYGMELRYV